MNKEELYKLISLQVRMGISLYKKTETPQHIVYPQSIKPDVVDAINKYVEIDENIFVGYQILGEMFYCVIQKRK